MINIDLTCLYHKCGETMLVSVEVDANDQLFLLAFAIREARTTRTVGS